MALRVRAAQAGTLEGSGLDEPSSPGAGTVLLTLAIEASAKFAPAHTRCTSGRVGSTILLRFQYASHQPSAAVT